RNCKSSNVRERKVIHLRRQVIQVITFRKLCGGDDHLYLSGAKPRNLLDAADVFLGPPDRSLEEELDGAPPVDPPIDPMNELEALPDWLRIVALDFVRMEERVSNLAVDLLNLLPESSILPPEREAWIQSGGQAVEDRTGG